MASIPECAASLALHSLVGMCGCAADLAVDDESGDLPLPANEWAAVLVDSGAEWPLGPNSGAANRRWSWAVCAR